MSSHEDACSKIRQRICELAHNAGQNGAHVGSSLSIVEILYAISLLEHELILSKGHGALGMYAVLEHFGFIHSPDLEKFNTNGTKYYCHAVADNNKIKFSGGSLSLGLSYSIGKAIIEKDKIFSVIVGDGELDEGLCWECLNFLSQNPMPNLKIIVDRNHLQSDGYKDEIISVKTLKSKLSGWNFSISQINGHDVSEILDSLRTQTTKTQLIIADTTKGKGFKLFENEPDWHYGVVSDRVLKLISESK
jgi:transketolase